MAAFYTLFYRVDSSEIELLLDPETEEEIENSLWLEQLGDLELVGLWECLPNSRTEETLLANLLTDAEADVLVLGVNEDFLRCVQSLSEDGVKHAARAWSAMEELADWDLEDLEEVIRDLDAFAREAAANNQRVVQVVEM